MDSHPPPLDFDEVPRTAQEIPLERHGALLLLAARSSASILFEGQKAKRIPIYPDLQQIMSNFVVADTANELADEQAQALHDALLALTVISSQDEVEQPADDKQFASMVLALTKCSHRQSYSGLRKIPASIVRSHSSETARFALIQDVFRESNLIYARESAIDWLKDEILTAAKTPENHSTFTDPGYFSQISSSLFDASEFKSLDLSSGIIPSWIQFSQTLAPYLHSALNLFYVIISSSHLRKQLRIANEYSSIGGNFLQPLKSTCHKFEEDLSQNGGDGRIASVVGDELCQVGMTQAIGPLLQIIEQIEEKLGNLHEET